MVKNASNFFMASFDVENLFTNIPISETISICLDLLFPIADSLVIGLPKKFLKSMLELSVHNSFFTFNSKFYKQTEGLGMGLPLGPTFANIFMCFHETKWLSDCPTEYRHIFYKRYIDDTFLLFRNETHAPMFLNYLNNKHANIMFTIECEHSNKLSFLDCTVHKIENKFQCSVFKKD